MNRCVGVGAWVRMSSLDFISVRSPRLSFPRQLSLLSLLLLFILVVTAWTGLVPTG